MNKKRDLINICVFYGSALCLLGVLATIAATEIIMEEIQNVCK